MSMSKAFDGFVVITGILCIAWFLLAIQLGLISLDSTYTQWHELLEGTGRFPSVSTRANLKSVIFVREKFFANNKLDLSYHNLSSLKTDLHRDRHYYKKLVVYVDLVITAGGFILWVPMVLALILRKLERFFSCTRGLFPILAGIFFLICGVASLVICILASLNDLDNYDEALVKGLKTVGKALPEFYRNHTDAQEAKMNCDGCDNNTNGTVRLSPQTWFLIILECLISKGKTISDVLPKANMKENDTDVGYAIREAKAWKQDSKPLVHINGVQYSRWMLMQLQFCPEDTVKQTIHGFLGFILFLAPLVMYSMWKTYGRRKCEKKPKEDKEQVLMEKPPEVIGSNKQITATMENLPDPGAHDPENLADVEGLTVGEKLPVEKDQPVLPQDQHIP